MHAPALHGLRVLDCSRLLPGPYCSRVLADLGADVLRVDHPDTARGDLLRTFPPHLPGEGDAGSLSFIGLNHGKGSVALDLTDPTDQARFLRLAERADVVLETFRPGVMDRHDVGWDALHARNPSLILCSISGYGQQGPHAAKAGHDIGYLARAGVLGVSGEADRAPQPFGTQVADIAAGALPAVIGILAALRERDGSPRQPGSGVGQHVDVSMTDGARALLPFDGPLVLAGEPVPDRGRAPLSGGAIINYRTYACADGYVALGALEPKFWRAWCLGVEREDWIAAQFQPPESEVGQAVAALFASRTREEWEHFAEQHDCCLEPVLTPAEAFERARSTIGAGIPATIDAIGPDGTAVPVPAPGIAFSRSPLAPGGAAPVTGADGRLEGTDLDARWPVR